MHQKIERQREREREHFFFCEGKVYKEWKKEWQIYSKRVWIRKDQKKKKNEDEGKDEEWY